MADLLRAYRRWLLRRLSYLLPVFVGALAANVWLAVGVETERGFQVISLVLSGLGLATLGCLLLETLSCAALQARGERRAARTLRGHLAVSWRVTAVCVVVFAALLCAPLLVRAPAPEAPRPVHARPSFVAAETAAADFVQVPPAEEPPALAAAEAAPRAGPELRPIAADVPPRLELEEKELEPPVAVAPFLRAPQEPPGRSDPEPSGVETFVFRPALPRGEGLPSALPDFTLIDRPGLRNEEADDAPPATWRLDLLLVSMEGHGRGGGTSLEGDGPVGRDGSVHAAYLGIAFGHGRELDELQPEWVWHRLTLGYQHRVLGFTRHAAFDLALTVGASLDRVTSEVGAEDVDPRARLSPYAAVDVGIWQGGPVGFVFHAGHSLPLNLTGASSGVTDVSAALRVDLSERLTFFAGYRMLWMELKEFPESLVTARGREELDASMGGPLAGFEYRF